MKRRRSNPEDQIQRAICQHLRARSVPGLVWFHVPNGGRRRPIEAAIFKGLGVRPGVSDLILLHNSLAFALELKAEDGRPTAAQMDFVSAFNAAGGTACIVHGLDSALGMLETWGLVRGRAT
jgi:hypothetical protein